MDIRNGWNCSEKTIYEGGENMREADIHYDEYGMELTKDEKEEQMKKYKELCKTGKKRGRPKAEAKEVPERVVNEFFTEAAVDDDDAPQAAGEYEYPEMTPTADKALIKVPETVHKALIEKCEILQKTLEKYRAETEELMRIMEIKTKEYEEIMQFLEGVKVDGESRSKGEP